MGEYVTRDSGTRQEFETGSRRDTQDGKPRYDLIALPALRRWADLMARGADKYGERNWELGQPLTRYEESAFRHLAAYLEGDRVEDHLAAVLFNVGGIMHHEAEIEAGRLPFTLDDRPSARAYSRPVDVPARDELAIGDKVRILAPAPSVEDLTADLVGTTGFVSSVDLDDYPCTYRVDGGWWYSRASLERVS